MVSKASSEALKRHEKCSFFKPNQNNYYNDTLLVPINLGRRFYLWLAKLTNLPFHLLGN